MDISKKLERLLFYLLLFSIPFQTRKILWQQNWYFNEWQAISLYGTDLLLIVLFLFWLSRDRFRIKVSNFKTYDWFLVVFVAISAVSIKNSSSHLLSFYNWLKLVEMVGLYFYLKNYAVSRFGIANSMPALLAGGLFQAVIAIIQFVRQSDLGLRILGETLLRPNMQGVAAFFNSAGVKVMRAYGTTPHPNVLATYLFLAIGAVYFVLLYKKLPKRIEWAILISFGLMLFALFSTFARVVIFVWAVGFIVRGGLILFKKDFREKFWKNADIKPKLIGIFSVVVIAAGLFAFIYWPDVVSRASISGDEEAVTMRVFYAKESLKSLNWFGIGSGNFVNWLMARDLNLARGIYQPVHNIYLLIYSENGILGIASFGLFLAFLLRDFIKRTGLKKLYSNSFLLIFLSVLFIGFFDHFLWTLQQGRLMFWLTAALLTIHIKSDTIDSM